MHDPLEFQGRLWVDVADYLETVKRQLEKPTTTQCKVGSRTFSIPALYRSRELYPPALLFTPVTTLGGSQLRRKTLREQNKLFIQSSSNSGLWKEIDFTSRPNGRTFECSLHLTGDYWVGHTTEEDMALALLAGSLQSYGNIGRWVDTEEGGLWICTKGRIVNE